MANVRVTLGAAVGAREMKLRLVDKFSAYTLLLLLQTTLFICQF